MGGVKVFEDAKMQKNQNSESEWHMISNLTKEQIEQKIDFDGRRESDWKTANQELIAVNSQRKVLKENDK